MILSYTEFPLLFTRYCLQGLDCAIPMARCLIRYGSNNLGRMSIDDNLKVSATSAEQFCLLGKFSSLKMPNYHMSTATRVYNISISLSGDV